MQRPDTTGRLVAHYRRAHGGMKQEQLAKVAGIQQSVLSEIENDHADIPLSKLYKIAEALEVPVTALLPNQEGNVFYANTTGTDGTFIGVNHGTLNSAGEIIRHFTALNDKLVQIKDELITMQQQRIRELEAELGR